MSVLRKTEGGRFTYSGIPVLRTTYGENFINNTAGKFGVKKCGSFTYNTGWQFYI